MCIMEAEYRRPDRLILVSHNDLDVYYSLAFVLKAWLTLSNYEKTVSEVVTSCGHYSPMFRTKIHTFTYTFYTCCVFPKYSTQCQQILISKKKILLSKLVDRQ